MAPKRNQARKSETASKPAEFKAYSDDKVKKRDKVAPNIYFHTWYGGCKNALTLFFGTLKKELPFVEESSRAF